jgi:predicted secreted protein
MRRVLVHLLFALLALVAVSVTAQADKAQYAQAAFDAGAFEDAEESDLLVDEYADGE